MTQNKNKKINWRETVGQIEDCNYNKKEINIIINRKQTVLQIKNKKYY